MSLLEVKLKSSLGPFNLDAQMNMNEPAVTALIGASGSGKTTFLDAIAGFHRAKGLIRFNEVYLQETATGIFLPPHKRRIAYSMQMPYLFPHKNNYLNLVHGYRKIPPHKRRYNPCQIIEGLGLAKLVEKKPHHLSGGEKQRIAIGRSLLTSPSLWLLDEPLCSLDTTSKGDIISFLKECWKKNPIPVLYVSHSLEEVCNIAQNVAIMENGTLTFHGTMEEALHFGLPPSKGTNLFGTVIELDRRYHLCKIQIEGSFDLWLPLDNHQVGDHLVIEALAEDILVSKDPFLASSSLNHIPCTIEGFKYHPKTGLTLLELKAGKAHLCSTISRKAFDFLNLSQGTQVWAHLTKISVH